MIIAHMPSGYIIAKAFKQNRKPAVVSSMIFGALPDLDLIYFYLHDSSATHRLFFPHLPIVMMSALLVTLPIYCMKFFAKFRIYYALFFANWLAHLVLDTFTERIFWLYPFSNRGFQLVEVPAVYSHWMISFVLHWSFAVELAIVAFAVILFFMKRKQIQEL